MPHPQLHGGYRQKNVWGLMEDESCGFLQFVDKHRLAHEEGSLFSYLIRVMNFGQTLAEVTGLEQFSTIENNVRACLVAVDRRLIKKRSA